MLHLCHTTCYLHHETPRNQCPCASRTLGSNCSTDNRRLKPAGSILEATPRNWVPWSQCRRSALGIPPAHRLGSSELAAEPLKCTPWSLSRKSGPWSLTLTACRLASPELSQKRSHWTALLEAHAGKQDPEFLLPKGLAPMLAVLLHYPPSSRTQNSWCPKDWFPCVPRNCHGSGSTVSASKPQSLCYRQTWDSCACNSCCGSWKPTAQCK
jgi:hypothetical protein